MLFFVFCGLVAVAIVNNAGTSGSTFARPELAPAPPVAIQQTSPERVSNTVWMSAGSTLVIGSLDQTAQHHLISTNWIPADNTHMVAMVAPLESSELFDVKRVNPADKSPGWAFEIAPYSDQGLPPVECDSEATRRRFAVPYFPGRGGAFERMVIANVIAAGTRTRVYLADDHDSSEAAKSVAHEIVHLMEIGLREFVEDQLVPIEDIDHDSHLTIVMCQLAEDDAVGPGEEPIRGCVREKDFLDTSWELGGDVIYVDTQLPRGKQLAAVLAHELAHAATFSAQYRTKSVPTEFQRLPFWLNEGIAHLLEYSVCPASDNLKDRLARYTETPTAFPLVMPDDYPNRMVRRGPARAAALSFLRFLATKRPDLLPSVLDAGSNGIEALEVGTGSSFAELFREWAVSEVEDARPTRLVSRHEARANISIAGTSFATVHSPTESGYVTIEASENAELQVTVVEAESAVTRVGSLEKSSL